MPECPSGTWSETMIRKMGGEFIDKFICARIAYRGSYRCCSADTLKTSENKQLA